jgi:hypothetical protein
MPLIASERDHCDVARRRAQSVKYRDRIETPRLVGIDAPWTKADMAPLRSWAPCGLLLEPKVPHGRRQTCTLVGSRPWPTIAPKRPGRSMGDGCPTGPGGPTGAGCSTGPYYSTGPGGPIDRPAIGACVLSRRRDGPGTDAAAARHRHHGRSAVILDTLGSRRRKVVRCPIRDAGTTPEFLPKSLPDLSSIEPLFAKRKHGLRNTAERIRDAPPL